AATSAHFPDPPVGCIGVPLPANTIKLAPAGDKLEIRVSGPNVTPGYFRAPELGEAAFDEEGFYRSGDAGKLVDPSDPNRGLLSECKVLSDAVICGHDREFVGALAWINQAEARGLCGGGDEVPADHPAL